MSTSFFVQGLLQRNDTLAALPPKQQVEACVERLFALLFTPHTEHWARGHDMANEYGAVQQQFCALLDACGAGERLQHAFFNRLPELYNSSLCDAQAFLQYDPAARLLEEVLATSPGFYAIALHRIAHALWDSGVPVLPRIIAAYAHRQTGIDIHPAACIGKAFVIDHGTGVVVGETARIGDNVVLYQGVTLGALSVAKADAEKKRHPTVENDVIIYAGATILGGDTVIGRNSIIGGNVWITHSVPPCSVVYHKSTIQIRDNTAFPSPLNFVI